MKLPKREEKIREYARAHRLHKRWYRLTALLAVLAAIVTTAVLILPAVTMENTGYDFSENITGVTVEREQGGQWTQSDTFTDGDTIRVTIRYAIPQGAITETQPNMHYQLPAGIALEQTETGDVYLENGQRAGTYTISTEGSINITFDEAFANGEAFSGNLHFQGAIALADLDEDQEIQFGGDGGSIIVVPEEKRYTLNIGKVGMYIRDAEDVDNYATLDLDIEQGDLIYYLSVFTNSNSNGSDGSIVITDRFTHNPADGVVTYDENNIVIIKMGRDVNGNFVSTPITDYTITYTQQTGTDDANTSSFTIDGLPALGENEAYEIYYIARPQGVVNSPNASFSLTNTATAKDDSKTVSASATVELSKRMVYKESDANEGTGNVSWTVVLNEDGRDLSGMTFRDEMYYKRNNGADTPYDLSDIENLRVTAYEINDAGQQVSKGDVTADFERLVKFENNAMIVQFPAAGGWPEEGASNWVYRITYETPFPEGAAVDDQISFTNTARLEDYYTTVTWNGSVPESGYGLVKNIYRSDPNTGTDQASITWQSTITYPSAAFTLEDIRYIDWIQDAYYVDSGRYIEGSHYTTLQVLQNTLRIENALGQQLNRTEDYNIEVVYAEDVTDGAIESATWEAVEDIFEQYGKTVTEQEFNANSTKPIALFRIVFTEGAKAKLQSGQRLYIYYDTVLDRQGVTNGQAVTIKNTGAIPLHKDVAEIQTAFHQQLNKQVSKTGIAPSGDDFALNSDVYVDGPVDIDLGDTGGRIYYRILFYNYTDVIEFHDDLLQKFDGKISFDQNLRIYDVLTGEVRTVKTWNYLDSSGKYHGNYQLHDLGQFKGCIIGLYYYIDVSGDEALADLGEGETLDYTNTVTWAGVGSDSSTAHAANGEPTLKKDGVLTAEIGENLVYYYVVVNPGGRDLHPTSNLLELRDSLTLPAGASAALRPETIGLYHYDPGNAAGHFLGEEVTEEEFDRFEAVRTEGAANTYTFTVPDGMACVVVYAYAVNPGTSALDEIPVNNTAALLGRAVISAGDNVTIKAQESGGQVNRATLTIYKIGGNDVANLLNDVLFDLFRYEQQEEGSYAWVRTDLTAMGTEAEDGGRHFITGGDGVEGAIILNFLDEEDSGGSHYNTLYRLTEFQSIDGYQLDPTPRYYVWGEAGKTEEDTAALMAEALEKAGVKWEQITFIPFGESKTDNIANEPTTTSISVTKLWQDQDGEMLTENLPDSVTVTLYQIVNGMATEYQAEGVVNPVTLNADNGWYYSWKNLPKEIDGQTVTYTVVEEPLEDWEIAYTYPGDGNEATGVVEGNITITNIKKSSFVLPETGGIGPIFFITAGLFLIGASGVGYLYLRRRRRREGDASSP